MEKASIGQNHGFKKSRHYDNNGHFFWSTLLYIMHDYGGEAIFGDLNQNHPL